jgi:hypothetical protein
MHIDPCRHFRDDKAMSRPAVGERREAASASSRGLPSPFRPFASERKISLSSDPPRECAMKFVGASSLLDQGASMY